MGSEGEQRSTPKLPLFIESYGGMEMMKTPPHHHTSRASVPFRWEEEPGKPKSCKAPLSTHNSIPIKGLELPPRLLYGSKLTTTTTTLLEEGPCVGRSIFHSSRFIRCREVSFDGGGSDTFRSLVVSKRWLMQGQDKSRGSLVRRGKDNEVVVVDDHHHHTSFSAYCGGGGDSRNLRKKRLTKPRFNLWEAIYETVKQVINFKSKEKH